MDIIFETERLIFRKWRDTDIEKMYKINQNQEVMKFFPALTSYEDTRSFIYTQNNLFEEKEFCYFAVELKERNAFIGFIGLYYQELKIPFAPFVDIGWRLDVDYWNQGLATEGANACLRYGFEYLRLENIFSVAPVVNEKSIHLMEKLGMKRLPSLNILY